ncbi:hypothetical protein [Azotobacter salinestris]|uniref:hypothetical protein n=1 Tax=Azotobacter salinestris TaxID=69964 RepID=UPI0032DE56BA
MNIEHSLRDPNVALPIIDGPEAGGMRTWPMDSFVVVTAPIWAPLSGGQYTRYRVRRHSQLGLVWASQDHPELQG